MRAYKLETTLMEDGKLVLHGLPFHAGEIVEVIVLEQVESASSPSRYPLRGMPYRYTDPAEPVAENDWEALSSLTTDQQPPGREVGEHDE